MSGNGNTATTSGITVAGASALATDGTAVGNAINSLGLAISAFVTDFETKSSPNRTVALVKDITAIFAGTATLALAIAALVWLIKTSAA